MMKSFFLTFFCDDITVTKKQQKKIEHIKEIA